MAPSKKVEKNNSVVGSDQLPRWTIMLYIAAAQVQVTGTGSPSSKLTVSRTAPGAALAAQHGFVPVGTGMLACALFLMQVRRRRLGGAWLFCRRSL